MLGRYTTKTGRAALESCGMPNELAAQIVLVATIYGTAVAVRAGHPSYLYDVHSAPKPSDVKAKTGDWGLTKGVIAMDVNLGKRDESGHPVNAGIEAPERIQPVQHRVTLRHILMSLQSDGPEFELVAEGGEPIAEGGEPIAETFKKSGTIYVRVIGDNVPSDADRYVFSIDLTLGMQRLKTDTSLIETRLTPQNVTKPDWWDDDFGNIDDWLDVQIPIMYRDMRSATKADVPLMIYGLRIKNVVVPITGDMDLLWITRPNPENNGADQRKIDELERSCPPTVLYAPLDMRQGDNAELMLSYLRSIAKCHEKALFDESKLDLAVIKRMGVISPFEAYFITIINQRFADLVEHVQNLYQHGAENRNPYKPSSLNGDILHIIYGQQLITSSEQHLVQLLLSANYKYVQQYPFDVHPQWDMALWHEVCERQVQCDHQVPDAIKQVLDEYERQLPASTRAVKGARRLSRRLSQSFERRLSGGGGAAAAFAESSSNSESRRHNSVPSMFVHQEMPQDMPSMYTRAGKLLMQAERDKSREWDASSSLVEKEMSRKIYDFCQHHSTKHMTIEFRRVGDDYQIMLALDHDDNVPQKFIIKISANAMQLYGDQAHAEVNAFFEQLTTLVELTLTPQLSANEGTASSVTKPTKS